LKIKPGVKIKRDWQAIFDPGDNWRIINNNVLTPDNLPPHLRFNFKQLLKKLI
jgi:hypothetical protein